MRTALTLSLAAAAALFTVHAQAADQTRSVAPFSAVSNSGPINLVIEVGKAQSVVVSGSDDYLEDVRTEVSGGELRIKMRNDSHVDNRHWNDMKVTITVPALTAFTMGGAGQTTLTHFSGDSLDIRFGGAGSLKADGSVKTLRLNVGDVLHSTDRRLRRQNPKVARRAIAVHGSRASATGTAGLIANLGMTL